MLCASRVRKHRSTSSLPIQRGWCGGRPNFSPGGARTRHLDSRTRPSCGSVAAVTTHPCLIQLVCKRYLEMGDLEEVLEQVASDRMVSFPRFTMR